MALMALGVGEQKKVDETTKAVSGEVWADKHLLEYLQAGKHSEEWDALERDRVSQPPSTGGWEPACTRWERKVGC